MSDRSALSSLPAEDAALLATLTPELARALYPEQSIGPFQVTAVYPLVGGDAADAVSELEAAATHHEVDEPGGPEALRRTTFGLHQVEEFHRFYHLVVAAIGDDNVELLVHGRDLPFLHALWLPLLWTLRK